MSTLAEPADLTPLVYLLAEPGAVRTRHTGLVPPRNSNDLAPLPVGIVP